MYSPRLEKRSECDKRCRNHPESGYQQFSSCCFIAGLEKPTKMSFCATSKYNLALEETLPHLTNQKENNNGKKWIQNAVTGGIIQDSVHFLQTNFLLKCSLSWYYMNGTASSNIAGIHLPRQHNVSLLLTFPLRLTRSLLKEDQRLV